MRSGLIGFGLAAISLGPSSNAHSQVVAKGDQRIESRAPAIRADMEFLADDLLEGREAGTRGDALTQLYLAKQFAATGLEPAGSSGDYLQRFRMRASRLVPGSVLFKVTDRRGMERSFANGPDVIVYGDAVEADLRAEAGLVFVGYGIDAPDLGVNDYAGIDAKGKVAVVLGGPPAFLPSAEAAHYGSASEQHQAAARHGAVGVIRLWTPALEQRYPWVNMADLLGNTDMNWLGSDGRVPRTAAGVRVGAIANGRATDALLAGGPRTMAQLLSEAKTRSPRAFALPGRLTVTSKSAHDDTRSSANVAGLLRGSDPILADEVVVVTAHFDHVGIGPAVNGDAINNGALDNASGTAMLLEVARRIASASVRPKRSVLFLAVGAEEKGLIGSDYFTKHPTLPRAKLVANINLDGAMPFYDFADVIAFGAEQSEMGELLAQGAGELGLRVARDPFPEEGIFTRSDQYSFVKQGVPALFLYMGFTDMAGRSVGRGWWDKMMASVVHFPSDDLSLPIDYGVMAKLSDVFRRVVLRTANADRRPRWYEESIFGKLFAPDAPKAMDRRSDQAVSRPR